MVPGARAQGAPRVRPTFELRAELSAEQVIARIRAGLSAAKGSIVAVLIQPDVVELVPHRTTVHFWSPQLRLDLDETDGTTRIRARFAPHPNVWATYMAVHAIGAFATIAAGVTGYSQYVLGQSPWALWALPISPVLAALVWALAFVGQGLGAEQMYDLRRFVEQSLAHEAEAPPPPA
jgi:hypothetical protein